MTLTRKIINTNNAPRPIAPYNQGVILESTLYVSGCLGLDKDTMKLVEGDVSSEARQALRNLGQILQAAESSYDKVIKTTIFMSDINDFSAINEVYKECNYYASTAFPVGPTRLVPPMKRQRLMAASARNGKTCQIQKTTLVPSLDQFKVYSNQDILICGNCREMFSDLHDLLEHKKNYCKLRFTCKCESSKTRSSRDEHSTAALLCVQCKDAFQNAWDLMVHAQAAHMINIYELGVPTIGNCSSPPISPRDNNTPDKDSKSVNNIEEENDEHVENGSLESGRDGMTGTPDSAHSQNDKDLEDLMDVEHHQAAAAKTIMHASIVREPASQPDASPPPIGTTARLAQIGEPWKSQTGPNFEEKSY